MLSNELSAYTDCRNALNCPLPVIVEIHWKWRFILVLTNWRLNVLPWIMFPIIYAVTCTYYTITFYCEFYCCSEKIWPTVNLHQNIVSYVIYCDLCQTEITHSNNKTCFEANGLSQQQDLVFRNWNYMKTVT